MHIEIMANFHSDIPETHYAIHLEVCSKQPQPWQNDRKKKQQQPIYTINDTLWSVRKKEFYQSILE